MIHIPDRLKEREINYPQDEILKIAKSCYCDTAIILQKLNESMGETNKDYKERKKSNGDLVILIVRGKNPVTIMFRRSTQNNTPEQLKVDKIIDLTKEDQNDH